MRDKAPIWIAIAIELPLFSKTSLRLLNVALDDQTQNTSAGMRAAQKR
jgi:hypothetical protein